MECALGREVAVFIAEILGNQPFVGAADPFADYCTEGVCGKVVKFGTDIPESESGVKFIEDKGLFGTAFELDGLTLSQINGAGDSVREIYHIHRYLG